MSRQYDTMCTECGGLIAAPNKAYGWAGNFCHCVAPVALPFRADADAAVEEAMRHFYNRDPEALRALVSRLIKQQGA